jgi:hypothetical protein
MAFEVFHNTFRDRIVDLTLRFPESAKTKSGEPFWSGHKKFPTAVAFDAHNPLHLEFVVSTANLFAGMLKVHGPKHPSEKNDPLHRWMAEYRDFSWASQIIHKLPVPAYTKSGVANLDEDNGASDSTSDDALQEKELEELLESLGALARSPGNRGLVPADFEKDDDDNFHIDFVSAAANLRAANYHINAAPRHKCKMIAGRIIPAVATTTAAATGLAMLELYKVLQGKPLEAYRNGNFDIGSNTYMLFEPNPASKIRTKSTSSTDYAAFLTVDTWIYALAPFHVSCFLAFALSSAHFRLSTRLISSPRRPRRSSPTTRSCSPTSPPSPPPQSLFNRSRQPCKQPEMSSQSSLLPWSRTLCRPLRPPSTCLRTRTRTRCGTRSWSPTTRPARSGSSPSSSRPSTARRCLRGR